MKKKRDVRKAKDPIQVWVKEVKQAKKDPIQMWVKVVEQPKKGPIQMWVKEVKDDRGDGERASMRATVSIVDEDGARHYQETKTVLREQRSVSDRLRSGPNCERHQELPAARIRSHPHFGGGDSSAGAKGFGRKSGRRGGRR
jgi:hypothetical protein